MRFVVSVVLVVAVLPASAVVVEEDVDIKGNYLEVVFAPNEGGTIGDFVHRGAAGNHAGAGGLLQEGFGVGSFYVPNRRLNEKLEIVDTVPDRPVVTYSYDCDGPNISGLHVTRTMEPLPDEASLRVTWRVENKGDEAQWVAPWVRNDLAPGGQVGEADRLDVPTLDGLRQADRTAYYPAARNWIAGTDPIEKMTIYGVFNADQTHSFETLWDPDAKTCGFQTAFVPRMFKPGDVWETVYRINIVRGLSHVDFADDALAVQIDPPEAGKLEVLIGAVKPMADLQIHARVLGQDGQVWKLASKKFSLDPSKVVRCSYEWQAPADGVYEFLAQLVQNGKPYPLGKDTASPHGGIDTQFVVGKPGKAAMEPWSDAPFALDRAGRTLRRAMACPGDTAVWFESPLEKIFPEDRPEPTGSVESTVRIDLARNERESFQIVLRPPDGTNVPGVTFRTHDLVNRLANAKIPQENIEIANVQYYPVRVPTHFEGPTGEWPDALTPFQPFTADGGRCSAVWFTIYAPGGLPAGKYVGMIELSAPTLDPVELWVEALVYDFDLPQTPALKTDFGFWPEAALGQAQQRGYAGSQEHLFDLYRANALAHRVTLRELAQFPAESADYAAGLKAFEPKLEALLAQGASCFEVPASLLDAPEQLRLADAFVLEHQLKDRAFCQIASEPPAPAWPRLFERVQLWKDTAPNIPLMITTVGLEPFFADPVDIWAVHLQILDTPNNRTVLERVGNGGEVWWYVNHCPPRPYGNFFIDFGAVEHRILFWQAWALGLRGFYYWNVNYCAPDQDPRVNLLDVTPANGNGFLLYPTADGPASSIRWESIRDGIEDHDYLVLLGDRVREAQKGGGHEDLIARAMAMANLQELLPNLVTFPRDPAVLEAKRKAIAQTIVELGQVVKR